MQSMGSNSSPAVGAAAVHCSRMTTIPLGCGICTKKTTQDEVLKLKCCNRCFCKDCIFHWRLKRSVCPVCNKSLKAKNVFLDIPLIKQLVYEPRDGSQCTASPSIVPSTVPLPDSRNAYQSRTRYSSYDAQVHTNDGNEDALEYHHSTFVEPLSSAGSSVPILSSYLDHSDVRSTGTRQSVQESLTIAQFSGKNPPARPREPAANW